MALVSHEVIAHGIGASGGIAIGPAQLLRGRTVVHERRVLPAEVALERARLDAAIASADRELVETGRALKTPREEEMHPLIEAYRLILNSDELRGSVEQLTSVAMSAESAVRHVVDDIVATFRNTDSPVFRARGDDIEALGELLLRSLLGAPDLASTQPMAGTISIGSTLSVIDVLSLRRAGVLGVATEHGGKSSHAAILLRGVGLPYVLGVHRLVERVASGVVVVVDGSDGTLILDPEQETLSRYRERQRSERSAGDDTALTTG
jgi:phosphoenolpyruvate-protein phosphotransferase (PTS system enzyme I)